jgi:N-acetylglucosamine-6-phosphate deacetylase
MSEMRTQLMKIISESYDRGVADALKTAVEATEKAIASAVAVEREACAKVCEEKWIYTASPSEMAEYIRARGKK